MELLHLSRFRQQVERWGMRWEQDWVVPRFGRDDLESPWPWPKPDGFTRRWQLADLIVDALESAALGQTGGFYLCPPRGRWCCGDGRRFYRIRNAILKSIGIPSEFDGVAYFGDAELDQLAAAVFAHCFMIDECVGDGTDDTCVYPSHGLVYVHFDDEEITWGMAARREPLRRFDQELERRGWGWLRDEKQNQWDWPLVFPA